MGHARQHVLNAPESEPNNRRPVRRSLELGRALELNWAELARASYWLVGEGGRQPAAVRLVGSEAFRSLAATSRNREDVNHSLRSYRVGVKLSTQAPRAQAAAADGGAPQVGGRAGRL